MPLPHSLSLFTLLTHSYARLLGQSLVPSGLSDEQAQHWLYESAPFALLAHNAAPDPLFIYGNKAAQTLFGYDWNELLSLPSRLSAQTPDRQERQQFLERVTRDGFATDYRGLRITKTGQTFWIDNTTVWQLIDDAGQCWGQAALIPEPPVSRCA